MYVRVPEYMYVHYLRAGAQRMSEEGTESPVTEVTVIGSCDLNMGDGNLGLELVLGLGLGQMMKLLFAIKL